MRLDEIYTTNAEETKKILISNDAMAICMALENLTNILRRK